MDDLALLKRHIEATLKIQCSNYKEDYIKRRLLSRMRSTGTATYGEYLRFLKAEDSELDLLKNALTINVTEFFRDADVYDNLKKEIFPSLFARRKKIRIWCAGCSTGEEPYSLAMILHEAITLNREITGQIYATDIDDVVLAKAKEGIYTAKTIGKLTGSQTLRHFTRLPDGTFQAKSHLKDLIRFRTHDLMSGRPISRFFDLISCRNVTIYFTGNQKDDLARLFHSALVTNGYYVMGKTEFLSHDVEELFIPVNSLQRIYMKKG